MAFFFFFLFFILLYLFFLFFCIVAFSVAMPCQFILYPQWVSMEVGSGRLYLCRIDIACVSLVSVWPITVCRCWQISFSSCLWMKVSPINWWVVILSLLYSIALGSRPVSVASC